MAPPHLSQQFRQEATEVIAGGRITETQAKELFDKVDTDNSGVIEYDEFKQVRLRYGENFRRM